MIAPVRCPCGYDAVPMSAGSQPHRASERLEAFSDGVFAIVITLLVIELALPHLQNPHSTRELFEALLSIRSRLIKVFS